MSRHGGFTLIELLIAISLAAGVTVAATLLARSSLDYEARHVERWAEREGARDAWRLVAHYWNQRRKEHFTFGKDKLLFEENEDGKRYLVGFSCDFFNEDSYSLRRYRWFANDEEIRRLQQQGAWPANAAETLLSGLDTCLFTFLAPPAIHEPQTSAHWVAEWKHGTPPRLVRLNLKSPRGSLPPMIFEAPSS